MEENCGPWALGLLFTLESCLSSGAPSYSGIENQAFFGFTLSFRGPVV
jgi:hypothetical protein